MKFKQVLCGVDFSPASVRAFETAVELARSSKAELHIMHVIEAEPVVSEWFPVRGVGEATMALEEKALTAMEALVAPSIRAFAGIPVTTEVTSGRAFVEILQRARDRKVDLIVLGQKG
ncbi:MAG TPA: universal stress protein [Candidatus Binatia bacterium]|jgi:nucleotide-binding universal stress UspA family protein|nr:universal stress protein [Candidatus Binatia bacterium]